MWRAGAFALALLGIAACSDLTKVNAPDVVQRPDLTNALGAVTFFNGAVRQFYSVFGGGVGNSGPFVVSSALFSDELTGAVTTGIYLVDSRRVLIGQSVTGLHAFATGQTARLAQLQALSLVKSLLPNDRWRIGQLYTQMAYLETFIGEMYCSGAPLSGVNPDFTPAIGTPLTTTQVFGNALANFDSALVYATDSARILNAARLGRGRVLLNLDSLPQAVAAVGQVPTAYTYNTEHTAAVQPNGAFNLFNSGSITVAAEKGGNGLDFATAGDPRIPTTLHRTGGDGTTPVMRLNRIAAQTSPSIITTGAEARLIEAEAALRAGNASWLTMLNDLRSTAINPAMAALTDPGTPTGRVDLLFRERAFWLFLTGHRLGDMRRLLRFYAGHGKTQATVYPVGPYKYGGSFEDAVSAPVDWEEALNNPHMGGNQCIDRNP